MKRISSVFCFSMFSLALILSCSSPTSPSTNDNSGTPTAPTSPIAAVSDTTFTGQAAASNDEVYDTAIASAQVLSSALAGMFSSSPSGSSRATGIDGSYDGYSITGVDDFIKTYKGTISGNVDKSWSDGSGASLLLKGSGSVVVSHNLTIYTKTDMYGNTSYVPGGDSVEDLSSVADGAAWMTDKNADLNASGTLSLSAGKIVKSVTTASGATANVTLEKAVYTLESTATANVTGLTIKCDTSGSKNPDVTSGTCGAAVNWKMTLLFVVSSSNSTVIKGGKLLLTANFDKSLTNLNIPTIYAAVKSNPTAMYSTIEGYMGDLSNVKYDIKVYDNSNTLTYSGSMTADDLATKLNLK